MQNQTVQNRGSWPERLIKASLTKGSTRGSKATRDYTPEQRRQLLKRAVQDVLTYGISVRLAAESHGVAKSSLSDYIRKHNINVPKKNGSNSSAPNLTGGNQPISVSNATSMGHPDHSVASRTHYTLSMVKPEPIDLSHFHSRQINRASSPRSERPTKMNLTAWSLASLPTLVPWQPTWRSIDCRDATVLQQSSTTTDSSVALDDQEPSDPAQENQSSLTDAEYLDQLCQFISQTPSPLHTISVARRFLVENGFEEINEADNWQLKPEEKYFFTRDNTSLIAFAVGGQWQQGNGFSILGASPHSPSLRLRPQCNNPRNDSAKTALLQCSVHTQGSGNWQTWADRDLAVAGRAVVRQMGGGLREQLVSIRSPILKLPSSCEQSELKVILTQQKSCHSPSEEALTARIAKEIKCNVADIIDWELWLTDTQSAQTVGLNDDFVSGPRLDSSVSCFCCLRAMLDTSHGLAADTQCRMLCISDNYHLLAEAAVTRVCLQSLPRSLLVSVTCVEASEMNSFADVGSLRLRSSCQPATAIVRHCLYIEDSALNAPDAEDSRTTDTTVLSTQIPSVKCELPLLGAASCRATAAGAAAIECTQLLTAFLLHFGSVRSHYQSC